MALLKTFLLLLVSGTSVLSAQVTDLTLKKVNTLLGSAPVPVGASQSIRQHFQDNETWESTLILHHDSGPQEMTRRYLKLPWTALQGIQKSDLSGSMVRYDVVFSSVFLSVGNQSGEGEPEQAFSIYVLPEKAADMERLFGELEKKKPK